MKHTILSTAGISAGLIALVALQSSAREPRPAAPQRPQQQSLLFDEHYPITQLPLDGMSQRIDDFAVIGGDVYYSGRWQGGEARPVERHLIRVMPQATAAGAEVQFVRLPWAANCLDGTSHELCFLDETSGELVYFDTQSQTVVKQIKAGTMGSLRAMAGGKTIAMANRAGFKYPEIDQQQLEALPPAELTKTALAIAEQAVRFAPYAVFLYDAAMQLEKPLVHHVLWQQFDALGEDHRNPLDASLSRLHVRASADREVAVVFSKNDPGITLLDANGALVAELPSPGSGMKGAPDGPFPGHTILYQSDVAMVGPHLFVVDNPGRTLWVLNANEQLEAEYYLPFVVTEIEYADGDLYFLGRDGQFRRWSVPASLR